MNYFEFYSKACDQILIFKSFTKRFKTIKRISISSRDLKCQLVDLFHKTI